MRRRTHRQHGIAVASSCDGCAHLIGSPEPSEHGIRMAIVCSDDAARLEALGWVRTGSPHEPDDITCLHYHQANWQGGHDGCCGAPGEGPA